LLAIAEIFRVLDEIDKIHVQLEEEYDTNQELKNLAEKEEENDYIHFHDLLPTADDLRITMEHGNTSNVLVRDAVGVCKYSKQDLVMTKEIGIFCDGVFTLQPISEENKIFNCGLELIHDKNQENKERWSDLDSILTSSTTTFK